MEYFYHLLDGALGCYLDMLAKLLKNRNMCFGLLILNLLALSTI